MSSYMHTHWRDLDAWKKEGLIFSTTSNEAVKLFDAALTQYTGWYEEPSVGGLEKSLTDLLAADPNFVMGHVMSNGIELISSTSDVDTNPQLKQGMNTLTSLAAKGNITDRERLHVQAVKEWADGYLHGMYAFGLVETNMYADAEKHALQGLQLNPRDCWSTHAQAHVLEMMGRQTEGISFLSTTMDNWTKGAMLACHNFWHWAIYHIEKGEYEAALGVFDSQVGQRVKSGAMLDMVDASSLLYRLEMEGVDVGNRWNELYGIWDSHAHDHILVFNDVHMLMCTLGAKHEAKTNELMDSLRDYIRNGSGTNCEVTREVGLALCEAFQLVDQKKYDQAVNLLKPVRYKIVKIGGSNAQRDLFNLFLIHAALLSSTKENRIFARRLLAERKALKENAPMTDRLMAKAMAQHVEEH
ncbi:tetratricopeptide repeat protein 38-like isoform X2 [Actinia tenebrosa]|uniref:Tetratricopeptide repeat protein 38 n=1 Tax=Actinia tenebrosa TaxID=6105 RepID=A0A6P8I7C6_ACTTE|nr:tetratricopeptide repeat protein 38-like isoform X2 [Actinia tenebrosa]